MTAPPGIPVVVVDAVHINRRGGRTVEIVCPFDCNRVDRRKRRPARHTHGWPWEQETVGSRCWQAPAREYSIIVPEHLAVSA